MINMCLFSLDLLIPGPPLWEYFTPKYAQFLSFSILYFSQHRFLSFLSLSFFQFIPPLKFPTPVNIFSPIIIPPPPSHLIHLIICSTLYFTNSWIEIPFPECKQLEACAVPFKDQLRMRKKSQLFGSQLYFIPFPYFHQLSVSIEP